MLRLRLCRQILLSTIECVSACMNTVLLLFGRHAQRRGLVNLVGTVRSLVLLARLRVVHSLLEKVVKLYVRLRSLRAIARSGLKVGLTLSQGKHTLLLRCWLFVFMDSISLRGVHDGARRILILHLRELLLWGHPTCLNNVFGLRLLA